MNNNRKYISFFTALYLFFITFIRIASAIDFDARDTRIDLPVLSTPTSGTNPDISADQKGHIYAVWSDDRRGSLNIFENSSFPDHGWLPRATPVTTGFPKPQEAPQGNAVTPKVCSDNSGHVYVVWVDDRAVKSGTGKRDIYFRYSKDFGVTWNPEFVDERIDSDNPTLGDSIDPQIACDEKGNVYIVWEDDRNRTGIYEIYFRSLQVHFDKPTDFIVYYQTPEVRLNTGVVAGRYPAFFPAISTDKNENVYVAWSDTRNKPEDNIHPGIYFNSSRNNGTTWGTSAVHIDTAPVGGALTFSPAVISNDSKGDVYAAWFDNAGRAVRGTDYSPDGTTDVYFNHSRDFGSTWAKQDLRIEMPNTGDHRADSKDVAIGSNEKGVVVIAWSENRYKKANNIFVSHSENYGESFLDLATNIRIDNSIAQGDGNASNPVVKVSNAGVVFASWVDKRGGNNNIYFNYSIQHGRIDSWQKGDFSIDYPNPPGDSTLPVMTIDEAGHFFLAWQDTKSALAKDNYNIFYLGGFVDLSKLLIEGQRLGQGCFIATAAYGSPFERHVELLRKFRDRYLLTNEPGREFVTYYYHFSPPVADYILTHSYLKPVVRFGLIPVVGVAAFFIYTNVIQKIILITLIMAGLGLGYFYRLRRKKK